MFSRVASRWIESNPECFYYDLRVKGEVKEITADVRRKSSWPSGEDIVLSSGRSMDRI